MISFEGVSKRYDDGTLALRNISFDVPRGEFCVLLGHSGAGKSTLLQTVNGLAKHSSGSVIVDGEELTEKTLLNVRRKVSMIHQEFNLVTRSSVAENVMSGALIDVKTPMALLGWFPEKIRQRCCVLMDKVGLEEKHLRRRARALSGGQQQRVGIARSLMLNPKIILADEPIASLDPSASSEILTLLRSIAKESNTTVLCSLHQVELARKFADRIIGIETGQVVFDIHAADLDVDALTRIYKNYETSDSKNVLERTKVDPLLKSTLQQSKN